MRLRVGRRGEIEGETLSYSNKQTSVRRRIIFRPLFGDNVRIVSTDEKEVLDDDTFSFLLLGDLIHLRSPPDLDRFKVLGPGPQVACLAFGGVGGGDGGHARTLLR